MHRSVKRSKDDYIFMIFVKYILYPFVCFDAFCVNPTCEQCLLLAYSLPISNHNLNPPDTIITVNPVRPTVSPLCSRPASTTGYSINSENNLRSATFSVSASCDTGYTGTAVATTCSSAGGAYTLTGCAGQFANFVKDEHSVFITMCAEMNAETKPRRH